MSHRSESLIEKVCVHPKTHTFTLNSMVPALRKNAQETGLRLCPFSNIWQNHVAPSVRQNK